MFFTVFTREGGIHCLLHEQEHDRHKHIIVDTPDDLFKLGVDNPDWEQLGLVTSNVWCPVVSVDDRTVDGAVFFNKIYSAAKLRPKNLPSKC